MNRPSRIRARRNTHKHAPSTRPVVERLEDRSLLSAPVARFDWSMSDRLGLDEYALSYDKQTGQTTLRPGHDGLIDYAWYPGWGWGRGTSTGSRRTRPVCGAGRKQPSGLLPRHPIRRDDTHGGVTSRRMTEFWHPVQRVRCRSALGKKRRQVYVRA